MNVSCPASTEVILSTLSTRRACFEADQPSRYHLLCRSTTAQGSISMDRSSGLPIWYVRRNRLAEAQDSIKAVTNSGLTADWVALRGAFVSRNARTGLASLVGNTLAILASAPPTGS